MFIIIDDSTIIAGTDFLKGETALVDVDDPNLLAHIVVDMGLSDLFDEDVGSYTLSLPVERKQYRL